MFICRFFFVINAISHYTIQMANSTSLAIVLHQSSNHDELFMNQTLQFSETLKDLKNLRKQLYSAAEYFEASYGKQEHKEMVIETLKEYATKAVVNTVDHLGSVSDKFNSFLTDNTTHFSNTHLRLSSLEQRMKLCREYTEQSGTHQHYLLLHSPHHHKRYFFPHSCIDEQRRNEQRGRTFSIGDDSRRFTTAVRSTILENQNPTRQASKSGVFPFSPILHRNMSNKTPTSKRTISPLRYPLLRSGSLLKRSSSPGQPRKLALAEAGRAVSVSRTRERDERIMELEKEQASSTSRKGKKSLMLKALMSLSNSRT